ncbi:MAG: CvpA family protein [Planctomycetia bacterium]|nr:CvpA family protein [Planctomycetia bacterium]
MSPCDYFDLAVVAFILNGAFMGLCWGFVSTLTKLLAPMVGFWAAYRWRAGVIEAFRLDASPMMEFFVSGIIFALISMVVYVLMNRLERFLEKHHLRGWNRMLGFGFGAILAVLFCWILAWGLTNFPQTRMAVTQSRSAKYLVKLAEFGMTSIPPTLPEEGETPTVSLAKIPEEFISRVQEDEAMIATNPEAVPDTLPEDENAQIRNLLDALDLHISGLLPTDGENGIQNNMENTE